jgi:hypothetical protein
VFIEALAFVYLVFLAGALALEKFRDHAPSRLSFALYRLLAGFGIIGVFGLLIGLFGFFNQLVLWVAAAFVLALNYRRIQSHTRTAWNYLAQPQQLLALIQETLRGYAFLKILATLWLTANFLLAFLPITGHDALDYHLPIMDDIAAHERLTFIPQGRNVDPYAYLPILGEIFNAVPTVMFGHVSDPYVFQLIQYALLIILVILLYDFAKRRLQHFWLAIALVFLLLSLMDFHREALHAGYIDILGYVFSFASLLLVVEANERFLSTTEQKVKITTSIPLFALSAAFLGLALSVKYTALFFVPINAAIFALAVWWNRFPLKPALRVVLRYALITLLIGGFWYVKNLIEYGNPVYPMGSDRVFESEIRYFFFDRTILNFFLIPYLIFGEWLYLENGTSSRLIVTAYFVLLYALLAFTVIVRRRLSFPSIALTIATFLFFIQLFYTSHQIRFLLPGMIILPVALIFLFDQLYAYLQEHWSAATFRKFTKFSLAGASLIFLLVFLANFRYFKIKYRHLVGIYDRETYILEIGGQ